MAIIRCALTAPRACSVMFAQSASGVLLRHIHRNVHCRSIQSTVGTTARITASSPDLLLLLLRWRRRDGAVTYR
jgi:hypothetical protein